MSLVMISASTSTDQDIPNPVSDSPIGFEQTLHRRISYVPQRQPLVDVAKQGRLLVCRLDSRVAIWSLPARRTPASLVGSEVNGSMKGWVKVLEMELKVCLPFCYCSGFYMADGTGFSSSAADYVDLQCGVG
jgi:hypothetical protein